VCPVINRRHCAAPAVLIVICMAHLEVRLAVDKPRASAHFWLGWWLKHNSADNGAEEQYDAGVLPNYL
jgi:hypothetical protein